MRKPHVIVIGGGLIGTGIAVGLTQAGAAVTLIDNGDPKASAAAAGMLAPRFEALHPRGGAGHADLLHEALGRWDDYARRVSDDPAEELDYRRNGVLGVGFPPGALPGASDVAVPEGVRADTARLVPGEGQVDPRRLLAKLRLTLSAAGGALVHADVRTPPKRGWVRLADGTEIRGDEVVVAAGAGAASLLDPSPPIAPVRGRAFLLAHGGVSLSHVLRTPTAYLCPKADGKIYLGATEEAIAGSSGALDDLWEEGVALFPALGDAAVIARFDGLRPSLSGGLPLVGPVGEVLAAIGHDRNGVLLLPWTVQKIRELIFDQR